MKPSAPLNPRQLFFVAEYLVDLNAKEAAIRAGYGRARAASRGYELLRMPAIRGAIAEAMAQRAQRTGITAERVLDEYAAVAFADMRDFADWGPRRMRFTPKRRLESDDTRRIAEIVDGGAKLNGLRRVKLFDKQAALDSLARILAHGERARFGVASPPPAPPPPAPPPGVCRAQAKARRRGFAPSPRQRRFAEEYLVDFNAYAAARRAGYRERTAAMNMTKMKRHPAAAALIAALVEARRAPIRVTADRVIAEYAAIAFADIGRIADWSSKELRVKPMRRVAPADSAAIAHIGAARGTRLRLRLHDKVYALDMLARHLGLLDPRMPGRAPRQSGSARRTSAALRARLGRAPR
ncbi:MAG TPA: terminase small subunit [Stellaceae bacterium]|nr:terminase small subunit [Stellaceae bacterium]